MADLHQPHEEIDRYREILRQAQSGDHRPYEEWAAEMAAELALILEMRLRRLVDAEDLKREEIDAALRHADHLGVSASAQRWTPESRRASGKKSISDVIRTAMGRGT